MTDKELLELAAKAAKNEVIGYDERKGLWIKNRFMAWNPLTDDGDALRLAVKLQMNIDIIEEGAGAHVINYRFCSELKNGDPYAATRRAIVRVAAEMAKNDPT
jgi:hypothetical protein